MDTTNDTAIDPPAVPADGAKGNYSTELRAAVRDLLATPGAHQVTVDWGHGPVVLKDADDAALARLNAAPDESVGISLVLEFSCVRLPQSRSVTDVWESINLLRAKAALRPLPNSDVAFVTSPGDNDLEPCDRHQNATLVIGNWSEWLAAFRSSEPAPE